MAEEERVKQEVEDARIAKIENAQKEKDLRALQESNSKNKSKLGQGADNKATPRAFGSRKIGMSLLD